MGNPQYSPPDVGQCRQYIAALTGSPGSEVTFQTFDDSPAKRTNLARILHGTIDEHFAELCRLNADGAGIFVMINKGDGRGRTARNVVAIRVLAIDEDGPPTRPLALQPSFIVRSAAGRHVYWAVSDGTPLEAFTPGQVRLSRYYSSDPNVKDLPRVLRLPGFDHRKGDPFRVTFEPGTGARYTLSEIIDAHPVSSQAKKPTRPVKHAEVSLADKVRRASAYLAKIPGAVSGSNGHGQTWAAALSVVRGFDLPVSVATELLEQEYNPRCDPPWSERELAHKVSGASENATVPWGYLLASGNQPVRSQTAVAVAAVFAEPKARADPEKPEQSAQPEQKKTNLRAVGPDDVPGKPVINVVGGELHTMVDKAESALLASDGPPIYQRGRMLVRTLRTESLLVRRGVMRPEGALVIHRIESAYMTKRLTADANWLKFDKRDKCWVPVDCPEKVAEVILASAGDWHVPVLLGILEAPTLRPDGSILGTPGYDTATGLLFDPGSLSFCTVPTNPTRDDAQKALLILKNLLVGFPFVAESDRSAALSAILTGLVRRSLPSAPLHAFRAPKMRSGKTLLADVVALMATGRPCAVLSQAEPEEERKRFLAILLAGDLVVCLDNLSRPLGGDTLCQVLTQESIQDRILGVSEITTVPTSVTLLATGNNLVIEGDLTSRVVPCDLDPQMERPEEREFAVNLREYIPANRQTLVPAALTILRAYHVAGRPRVNITRWGGFDEWNGWIRAALVWLGQDDPTAGRIRIEDSDPVRRQLRTLLSAWSEALREEEVTVSELVRRANSLPTLREAIVEVAAQKGGEINMRTLGNFLRRNANRIEEGKKVVPCGTSHHASVWSVVEGVRGVRGVSSLQRAENQMTFLEDRPELTPLTPLTPPGLTCDECGGTEMVLRGPRKIPVCVRCWGPPKEGGK